MAALKASADRLRAETAEAQQRRSQAVPGGQPEAGGAYAASAAQPAVGSPSMEERAAALAASAARLRAEADEARRR